MILINCKYCNNSFKSYPSDKRVFCSRRCFDIGKNKINLSKPRTKEVRDNISQKLTGRKVTWITNTKVTNPKGTFTKNHKINEGKIHTQKTKDKIGKSHRIYKSNLLLLLKKFKGPNFNPKACQIIENYGKENGYNFQHALNGGEFFIQGLGYWVDGYDKEKNIVIEYYEKWHKSPSKIDKDLKREKEIIEYLHCKFIKIEE